MINPHDFWLQIFGIIEGFANEGNGPISLFIALQSLSCCETVKRFPQRQMMSPAWAEAFLLYAFRLSQVTQHRADIGIEQNGLLFKAFHCDGFAQIDADVGNERCEPVSDADYGSLK